ncbi:TIR domain-containing protein [Dinghuibacter silviterrae]|uniref:Pentapeptide repeat protein n=1 Tax=Dinghuibacter silviterrae TaxID=1539049 RepID=A0A4R8DHX8_9BACT|nr:TIR domain-containing protein [Dinghuibacter silviterrae]TDW97145.1 pentapeptide repeat protein [Dinghuibacter silviterrae]
MSKAVLHTPPKIILQNKKEILDYIKNHAPEKLKDNEDRIRMGGRYMVNKNSLSTKAHVIKSMTFENVAFKGDIQDIEFVKCTFKNCDLDGIWGFYLIFTKVKFIGCGFRYSRYSHLEFQWNEVSFKRCEFRNVEWDEAGLLNISFEDCWLINFKLNGVYPAGNITYSSCNLEGCHFAYINYSTDDGDPDIDPDFYDLLFSSCTLTDTLFNSVELRNSLFHNTVLYKCAFMECRLSHNAIAVDDDFKSDCYASLDFQTILKSELLSVEIMERYFHVTREMNIKETVHTMTSKINFYTVFISYSLKDQLFANLLNDALRKKGIRTFLWEKDAPAGKSLEEIMSGGVHKNHKVLFIASEHSIKSKACQFELSEARRKQETLWETIFFPIHIDSYLFSVQKRDIRPISMADEYWENIQELRRVNSIDFSKFNQANIDKNAFELSISKIIQNLQVTKSVI